MILEGFLFGLTIAIAIGPIALIIVNASITRGTGAGMSCGAGAASADFTFALIAFAAGSGLLALLDAHRQLLAYAAALLLCALGGWLALAPWLKRRAASADGAQTGPGFRATYALTLANPLTILLYAAWLGSQRYVATVVDALAVAIAIFAGSLLIQAGLALAGGILRPLIRRPATLLVANTASGIGILAFGVVQFLRQ